ncbi:MAG: LytTR family DNA-binding domain-containing protein [Bacteroidota bacterium]
MLKVIIVDDEQLAINTLCELLNLYQANVEIVGTAQSVEKALGLLQQQQADILFLDINLGQNTGFDLLNQLEKSDFQLVFTTAYDQFALKAFQYHAIDYLLKPIDPNALLAVVERVRQVKQRIPIEQLVDLLDSLSKKKLTRLSISTSEGLFFLELQEIVRLESFRTYTTFFMRNGKKVTLAKTIKAFENILPPEDFFRVHQSHIVNIKYISSIARKDGGYAVTDDGQEIPISRRKKALLIDLLNRKSLIY